MDKKEPEYVSVSIPLSNIFPSKGVKCIVYSPALPTDKREVERFIVDEFYKHLGVTVKDVRLVEDDADGKPDVVVTKPSGKEITVQVTEWKFEHEPKSQSVGSESTTRLRDHILAIYEPNRCPPILIHIFSSIDHGNTILKLRPRDYKQISTAIVSEIAARGYNNVNESIWIKVNLPKPITMLVIEDASSLRISPEDKSILIDFQFQLVTVTKQDTEKKTQDLYRKKEKGKADVLLIWSQDFLQIFDAKDTVRILIPQFANSSYKCVFFFVFFNHKQGFYVEGNKKYYLIKGCI